MKKIVLKCTEKGRRFFKKLKSEKGFGLSEFLGIAAALIIAAFVIIPGLKSFATELMADMNEWWQDVIAENIFPES
jgi:hypothetical protein